MFHPLSFGLLLALAGAAPTLAQPRVDATKSTKAPAAKVKPPVKPVLPEATQEQKAASERTYFGNHACEFNQTVRIERHPNTEGYVNVAWKQQVLTMRPVLSSTGALRLEDVDGRKLVIQIPSKSMLMDVKRGVRLLDECVSPEHRANIERMKQEGDSHGIGIDPVKTAAAAAVAVAAFAPAAAASRPAAASTAGH